MVENTNLDQIYLDWYVQNKELYNACASSMQRLLSALLSQAGIAVHSIQYRIKEQDSFLNKCRNSKYEHPLEQITDVCGLRVITYTNKNVAAICKIIENQFCIDYDNSVNKAEQMHENEVGYLSVHYIAKLNNTRSQLDEYKPYNNIRFEIQVRTLLQHAWAEIEHDRSYKFSGALPKELKRRFYLVAGALEIMDREFDCLSDEIDAYAQEVKEKTKKGNLDVEIDSTSLIEYLNLRLKDFPVTQRDFVGKDKEIIQELTSFGIQTLANLNEILTNEILTVLNREEGITTYLGAMRAVMMITDPDKYFKEAWDEHWYGMDKKSFEFFEKTNANISKYKKSLRIH